MEPLDQHRVTFHYHGILGINFKEGIAHRKFMKCLEDISENNLKKGFTLEEKYPSTADLRPNAHEYDESIIDVLFESDVPHVLKNLLGQEMYLYLAQVRQSYYMGEEQQSYMSWHRDTHLYDGGKMSGNIPPVYKIIFYPNLTGREQKCLMYCRGSHLRITPNKELDHSQINQENTVIANSSNIAYSLFNTSGLHHAIPPKEENGQLRVVYSFCLESQLKDEPKHSKLHDLYKAKLKEYNENLYK
tara:strand:+ start:338 stop:1072 length:735 start_codon:yes stop_codon:yes gene_type:complete